MDVVEEVAEGADEDALDDAVEDAVEDAGEDTILPEVLISVVLLFRRDEANVDVSQVYSTYVDAMARSTE